MKENGYTSSSIVADITLDDLVRIEQYTDQFYRDLIDSLDCCNAQTYQKQNVFRFLPGHRSFVLRLPIEVQKMKGVSSTKRPYKSKNQSENSTLPPKPKSNITPLDIEMAKINQPPNTNEAGEFVDNAATEMRDEGDLIADSLQAELIHKLKQAGAEKKHSWTNMMQTSVISEIEVSFDPERNMCGAKCQVICPFCSTKYSIKHDRFWRTSNFLKHLYSHESEISQNEKENAPLTNATAFEFDGFGGSNDDDEQNTQLNETVGLCIETLKSPDDDGPKKPLARKRVVSCKGRK